MEGASPKAPVKLVSTDTHPATQSLMEGQGREYLTVQMGGVGGLNGNDNRCSCVVRTGRSGGAPCECQFLHLGVLLFFPAPLIAAFEGEGERRSTKPPGSCQTQPQLSKPWSPNHLFKHSSHVQPQLCNRHQPSANWFSFSAGKALIRD